MTPPATRYRIRWPLLDAIRWAIRGWMGVFDDAEVFVVLLISSVMLGVVGLIVTVVFSAIGSSADHPVLISHGRVTASGYVLAPFLLPLAFGILWGLSYPLIGLVIVLTRLPGWLLAGAKACVPSLERVSALDRERIAELERDLGLTPPEEDPC